MISLHGIRSTLAKGGIRRWVAPFTLAVLTVAFFAVAVWNLGSLQFPTSNWIPHGEDIRLDLGTLTYVSSVYLLIQEDKPVNVDVYSGSSEDWTLRDSLTESGTYRQWRKLSLGCETQYIRLLFRETRGEIGEVAVFADSRRLEVQSIRGVDGRQVGTALIDEQSLVATPLTYQNSTYFDEIYFVQAADDYLRSQDPFEWSHPPLGKLIITLGIMLFGSNPFAWRILGVVLATLMIPLVYLLARRMFGTQRAGLIAAFLLAVDFMHFTEARLATGETFILLFVILMFYFFYRYYQGPSRSGKDLFLSVLCFGLGFSVKWIAVYGFFALLVLLVLIKWRERIGKAEVISFLGGLGAAGAVYLLSYIPYFLNGHSLTDFVELQFSMFGYHAGLEASHPYSSPWWGWPLMLRPLWLYAGQLDGFSSNIVLLGNPVLWWSSIPCMLLTCWLAVRRNDKTAIFIVIPFLAQWLLFATIPRILFIYHFYPNVLFMVLATTLWMERLQPRWRWGVVSYLALAAAVFLLLYPIISGLPVPQFFWDRIGVKWL